MNENILYNRISLHVVRVDHLVRVAMTLIILGSAICYGQNARTKRERVINSIVGNWTFKDGYDKVNKDVEVDIWPLLDSITFNSDMTFEYKCQDTKYGNLRVTGTWDIDSTGEEIKFMNRISYPRTPENAIDFHRKFKLTRPTKLRIEEEGVDYEIPPDPINQRPGRVARTNIILNYSRQNRMRDGAHQQTR
jgi:hypothetical protein